ncbi:MAG: peptidylprolyl isomerase [Prolixibacteraceae bacterium]|nr:peptidylprolyl isomerase [Prolixibacteraceae bacterium]MBN2775615.1 peptidylprolyl isomerase [Prolixibacteraceae bacterium]
MKRLYLLIVAGILLFPAFTFSQENARKKVLIETDFGNIEVELFNETPQHRDNFIKLVKEGFYDGLLFHRVINNFMIQGGDPNSRNAQHGQVLGSGDPGYKIPAEIVPEFYHKKGALAAARQGDRTNPKKESSGSQFYIVHGTVYTPGQLDTLEMQMNAGLRQEIMRDCYTKAEAELNKFREAKDEAGFNKYVVKIRTEADSLYQVADKVTIPENRKKDYTTIGGYPSLDGQYTVFGQVIEGLDVIDKIAAVKTDQRNRPVEDVKMKIKILE